MDLFRFASLRVASLVQSASLRFRFRLSSQIKARNWILRAFFLTTVPQRQSAISPSRVNQKSDLSMVAVSGIGGLYLFSTTTIAPICSGLARFEHGTFAIFLRYLFFRGAAKPGTKIDRAEKCTYREKRKRWLVFNTLFFVGVSHPETSVDFAEVSLFWVLRRSEKCDLRLGDLRFSLGPPTAKARRAALSERRMRARFSLHSIARASAFCDALARRD